MGFNGQPIDIISGDYHLGSYRTYNTGLMRFHSPDSASPFSRGGINTYAYCAGDPINHQDPSGHFRLKFIEKFFKKDKTVMQRRDKALAEITKNPALKPYQKIADTSTIKKELKTISDTGKALNAFTKLMEKNHISLNKKGKIEYHSINGHRYTYYLQLEAKVKKHEKTLDSLLLAYPQPKENELGRTDPFSAVRDNKHTRAQS
jgi:RHS repeat-associated protein